MKPQPPPVDTATVDYFDQLTPEYSVERLAPAAKFITGNGGPGSSLIDLGCGTGNTLEYLTAAAGVSDVGALDVSPSYLDKTRERLHCSTTRHPSLTRTWGRSSTGDSISQSSRRSCTILSARPEVPRGSLRRLPS